MCTLIRPCVHNPCGPKYIKNILKKVCDFTSLVIAITKGKRTRRQTSSSGCDVTTTLSSSGGASSKASNRRKMHDGRSRSSTLSFEGEGGGAEERRKKYVGMRQQLKKQGSVREKQEKTLFKDLRR